MFISEVVRQLFPDQQPLRVLDLCAAPGGKSTALLSAISVESILICNEMIKPRYQILYENLLKWGYSNAIATNQEPKDFAALEHFFDIVLVDAPCSGEGLFRKDQDAVTQWSTQLVENCAIRQKKILEDAQKLVKPNGYLIYSTCTYNDKENMQNVSWLMRQFPFQSISLQLPLDWNIWERKEQNAIGYQFLPNQVEGEGFFVSCLQKANSSNNLSPLKNSTFKHLVPLDKKQLPLVAPWIQKIDLFHYLQTENNRIFAVPKSLHPDFSFVAQNIPRHAFTFEVGTIKGKDFIPSHALALSIHRNKVLPSVVVEKDDALRFLKKENFSTEEESEGWKLITYQGNGLGWIKKLQNRINNYLPKDWRIRMDLDLSKLDNG
jgi:NOL1/NOP2/fmu family ribosome biogenesis protein